MKQANALILPQQQTKFSEAKQPTTKFIAMAFSWELYQSIPIIGILRGISEKLVDKIIPMYQEAGFTNIEITMNTPGAAHMIQKVAAAYGGRLNVGAGTVCTEKDLDIALGAGASYIVTPIINEAVIQRCVQQQIPVFPGAYTPTEIYKAWSLGADMVKVFPANRLGPEYIKEVKSPLNEIKLVPTGGVSMDNFIDFFKAGADGVGMGGQLFSKPLIEDESWDDLFTHFTTIRDIYQQLTAG